MKAIPGYEGLYSVDELGNVYSHNYRQQNVTEVLKQRKNSDGRWYVVLSKDGLRKTLKTHRLVLLAFVGEAPEGYEACHNDGNADNNTLANLRWDSRSSNAKDKYKHGYKNWSQKLDRQEILRFKEWFPNATQREMAFIYDVHQESIGRILRNKTNVFY